MAFFILILSELREREVRGFGIEDKSIEMELEVRERGGERVVGRFLDIFEIFGQIEGNKLILGQCLFAWIKFFYQIDV